MPQIRRNSGQRAPCQKCWKFVHLLHGCLICDQTFKFTAGFTKANILVYVRSCCQEHHINLSQARCLSPTCHVNSSVESQNAWINCVMWIIRITSIRKLATTCIQSIINIAHDLHTKITIDFSSHNFCLHPHVFNDGVPDVGVVYVNVDKFVQILVSTRCI